MQVVSLRRIEEVDFSAIQRRSVFYLVPKMIVTGLLITPILLAIFIKVQEHRVEAKPANVTIQAIKATIIDQPMDPDQLLPESKNYATYMANQVFRTLTPSKTDCIKFACVAITFDDGPRTDSTPNILSTLERHNINATFFEIGKQIKGNEKIIQRMSDDGNDVGNHSWSHPSFTKLKPDQISQQINETQNALFAAGATSSNLVRPPYGDFDLGMLKTIQQPVILWNVDPKDWSYKDPKQITTSVEKVIKPGAIIVMHDRMTTAKALDKIFKDLSPKYKFVTVTELLNLKPGSKGAYIGR